MNAFARKPIGLVLVPTPLDFGCATQAPITDVLPQETLYRASQISHWICEEAKSCRAFLKRVAAIMPLRVPIQQQHITALPRAVHKKGDHGALFDARELLQEAMNAIAPTCTVQEIGLVSEAGMPAIADPGSSVVRAAHALGLEVLPLVGPCSLILALAASGLNGQKFAFVGYLPIEVTARQKRLRELELLARQSGQTQIFIEVAHRNAQLWQALLTTLAPNTWLSIASGLSLHDAWTGSASVAQWRHRPAPNTAAPCVISMGL